jgi:hypothetical protein
MIWIDGEKEQRINGTGGEDYFNAAWGFTKPYDTPLVGLVEFTGYEPGSRNIMYRWHLEAPIRFHKSIKVTIEDGHASMRSDNIYSVAYWYQMEPRALPAVAAGGAADSQDGLDGRSRPGPENEVAFTPPAQTAHLLQFYSFNRTISSRPGGARGMTVMIESLKKPRRAIQPPF